MSTGTVRTALAAVVAVLATGVLAAPAAAHSIRAGEADDRHGATRRALEQAVRDGVPGAVAQARDRAGSWSGTAGVGDLDTRRERTAQDRYRIGSVTKTFVATVLLQLEAEGRLDLDDTVERWLPGTVRGNGHDGRHITLRQLLNHTSGIFSYSSDPDYQAKVFGEGFLRHRYDTWTPGQLVGLAMRHQPHFPPGTDWQYSNTNYTLAGMVVGKVTGRGYETEIERRILRPLQLRATSVPRTDPRVPGPASHAYSPLSWDPAAKIRDVTELNPSLAGAGGGMISDSKDLQKFFRALLKGGLLPPEQRNALTTTVPIDPQRPEYRYGLGLQTIRLSCGKEVWGHGGGIHGSQSEAFVTRDASHSLALNFNGDWAGDSGAVIEAEFCG